MNPISRNRALRVAFALLATLLTAVSAAETITSARAAGTVVSERGATTGAVRFARPVACEGRCRIAKLVDLDGRRGHVRDALGAEAATDGHAGIDIAPVAAGGVRQAAAALVLASADGVVVAARDGLPDRDARTEPRWWLAGREGGNLVVVDHGGAWRTAYVHLARGSVMVRPGQRVRRGQVLGRPGMSGYAAFIHVEFRISHRGRVVDPVGAGLLTMAELAGAAAPRR